MYVKWLFRIKLTLKQIKAPVNFSSCILFIYIFHFIKLKFGALSLFILFIFSLNFPSPDLFIFAVLTKSQCYFNFFANYKIGDPNICKSSIRITNFFYTVNIDFDFTEPPFRLQITRRTLHLRLYDQAENLVFSINVITN